MALVVGLMFLLLLTLLGLTSSNVSVMQERMASNVREYNIAFQEAEATLREIERRLVQIAQGTSGGIPPAPGWADDINLVNLPNDCTLERRYGVDWDSVPWLTAPDTQNDYYIIALSDFINPNTGLPQGSACRPMDDNQRPDGSLISDRYYLVLARAFGPGAADGGRRAEALVQSIFFWPE
ncbi:MAG: hypothetical protein GVY32_07795 [Gammaproteobacteria bacterium]|nr:hypothetical protein [Gammaproteobacteria bacterium]